MVQRPSPPVKLCTQGKTKASEERLRRSVLILKARCFSCEEEAVRVYRECFGHLTFSSVTAVSSTMKKQNTRKQNPLSKSSWVSCQSGHITAAGAPSLARLREWKDWGATDVVTLQRGDEMRPELPAECRALELTWWHRPLSGKRLEAKADRDSLTKLRSILALLAESPGRKIVLHCSAGLHRTGVFLYLLLRESGLCKSEALAKIHEARPLTAQELERSTKRSGVLVDFAETFVSSS